MWAVRFLNGPMAGQIINLKPGKNILGRGTQCDIKISHKGISKEHLVIDVLEDKLIFKDLVSRNGSFINGVRIEHGLIQSGDKISLHETLIDVVPAQLQASHPPLESFSGNAALDYQMPPPENQQSPQAQDFEHLDINHTDHINDLEMNASESNVKNIWARIHDYIEYVIMPGIYKLPTLVDFRLVIAGFLGLFIIIVTFLSAIPMAQLTKSSIQKESRRRTMTIARSLAQANHQALLQNQESSLDTSAAELEEGVTNALIISHTDGSILAPATQAGEYQDLPFIHRARRESKELVEQLNSSTIGASVPISYYDANMGSYRIKAHAIVLYNMGTLAVDDGRALSLFVQTLFIALIFGAVLFFFIYKLMEFPILALNQKLDTALKEGQDSTEVDFKLPVLQKLITNINSLLSRSLNDEPNDFQFSNRDAEAENIIQLIGYPAIAFSSQNTIIAVNESFESITEQQAFQLQNKSIEALPDQALQLNLKDLLERSEEQPSLIVTNNLNISGEEYQIHCQSICGTGQNIDYYLMSLVPIYNDDGGI